MPHWHHQVVHFARAKVGLLGDQVAQKVVRSNLFENVLRLVEVLEKKLFWVVLAIFQPL